MKICTNCKKEKSLTEFHKHIHSKDGLKSRCKACSTEYNRAYYKKNPGHQKALAKNQRQKGARWLQEYKSTLQCTRCGEDHPATLDFHHKDATKKEGNIPHLVRGWGRERILKEIAKCIVVCSNCHRKIHYAPVVQRKSTGLLNRLS